MAENARREPIKWSFDLNLREHDAGYTELKRLPPTPGMKKYKVYERRLENEMFSASSSSSSNGDGSSDGVAVSASDAALSKQIAARKRSKAMELALSPGKQILMNGFMMYMSGKNLNMFSISITGMAIMSPLTALATSPTAFARFEDAKVDLQIPRLAYVALNLLWLGVGLYKMATMRLLPTTSADWSGTVVWKEMMEISSVPP